eukprot:2851245-Pyramimonas_sp.AAC.1
MADTLARLAAMDLYTSQPDPQWRAELDLPWHQRALQWLWLEFVSLERRIQFPPSHGVPVSARQAPNKSMTDYVPASEQAAPQVANTKQALLSPCFWVATAN